MGNYLPTPLTAYDLFRIGHDTLSISSILSISEAEALKQVSSQRSARLGRRDPFITRAEERAERVAYAGRP